MASNAIRYMLRPYTYPMYCCFVHLTNNNNNEKLQININTHISPGALGSGSQEEPKSVVQMTRRAHMCDAVGRRVPVPILTHPRTLWPCGTHTTNTDPLQPNKLMENMRIIIIYRIGKFSKRCNAKWFSAALCVDGCWSAGRSF